MVSASTSFSCWRWAGSTSHSIKLVIGIQPPYTLNPKRNWYILFNPLKDELQKYMMWNLVLIQFPCLASSLTQILDFCNRLKMVERRLTLEWNTTSAMKHKFIKSYTGSLLGLFLLVSSYRSSYRKVKTWRKKNDRVDKTKREHVRCTKPGWGVGHESCHIAPWRLDRLLLLICHLFSMLVHHIYTYL